VWKIEKIVSKGKYNYAIIKGHPFATKHGYILEHRAIIENHIKRVLNPKEVVHHKNGNTKDNRLENLELLSRKEHSRMHQLQKCPTIEFVCPNCGKRFFKKRHRTFLACKNRKFTACSRKCAGTFNRKIQLFGLTPEVKRAISVNIVREIYSHDNTEQTINDGMRRDYTPST
jgi:hypothetical protein